MSDNSKAPAAVKPEGSAQPGNGKAAPVIHRVCVQCNNMFRVPADKFDAKQCPNCHKG